MPVSSVVVSCQVGRTAEIESRLKIYGQVEIHHLLDNGSIIAVLETDTVDEEVSLVTEMMQTDGVLDVRLAYHNFEDLQELQT